MGAIHTPGRTAEQVLKEYSKLVSQRISKSDQSLSEAMVRKFPSSLQPEGFYPAGDKNPFDKARFHLVMSNQREEWQVTIDLIFHSRKRLLSDGSMVGEGVQFSVITEEGKSLLVDYFCIDSNEIPENWSAEEWCSHWLKKLVRSPNISAIFAHKAFLRELEH